MKAISIREVLVVHLIAWAQGWISLLMPSRTASICTRIRRQRVILDHRRFVDVVLQECDVYYLGGPVDIAGLSMVDCQRVTYMGRAGQTVKLLNVAMPGSVLKGRPAEYPLLIHAVNATPVKIRP